MRRRAGDAPPTASRSERRRRPPSYGAAPGMASTPLLGVPMPTSPRPKRYIHRTSRRKLPPRRRLLDPVGGSKATSAPRPARDALEVHRPRSGCRVTLGPAAGDQRDDGGGEDLTGLRGGDQPSGIRPACRTRKGLRHQIGRRPPDPDRIAGCRWPPGGQWIAACATRRTRRRRRRRAGTRQRIHRRFVLISWPTVLRQAERKISKCRRAGH